MVGDLGRHGEHDVEVRHVEQLGLAVREPLRARQTLALGAVPVAAGVVSDPLMAALAASLDMTAERGGAAILDRAHGMSLRRRQ